MVDQNEDKISQQITSVKTTNQLQMEAIFRRPNVIEKFEIQPDVIDLQQKIHLICITNLENQAMSMQALCTWLMSCLRNDLI